ncbi:MAG: cytidylate kinase family protein, partial [Kiritimatiellae bacterium]|nr:cytidylate kinase family protein [Kiritimatiellia bacterium]
TVSGRRAGTSCEVYTVSELIDALKMFLKTPAEVRPPECCLYPFVTLTRQEGVPSHEVGRAIISRLDRLPDQGWNRGWELMDQQLCAWMIKTGAVPASFDEMISERYGEKGVHQMVYEMLVGTPEQYDTRRRVGEVIAFLLRFGRVVVVGCAAAAEAAVLEGPGVRLRLVSSMPRRLKVLHDHEKEPDNVVRRRLQDGDAEKARLLREHYRRDIDDPTLYDVSFLADRLSTDEVARSAVALLQARMEPLKAKFQAPISLADAV